LFNLKIAQYTKDYYHLVYLHITMNVSETAEKIISMEIRGAGKIARAAAEALKSHALELEARKNGSIDTNEQFIAEMRSARKILKQTRPTAVSLENALNAVLIGLENPGLTLEEMIRRVSEAADRFCANSYSALDKIAELCASKVQQNYTIMTHCNSTAAVKSIIKANDQGKAVRVFATETRPWGQGYITAQALADAGVDTTLIVDSAVRYFMKEVDIVIVGADTIVRDGTVVNKIGTSQVASAAHEYNIPVFVCAETYKFSTTASEGAQVEIEERDVSEIVESSKLDGVKLRNPVFDITQPKFITSIITEVGEILPKEADNFIKNLPVYQD
jgi:ribose 1,5-bisphosphate isomerase